MIRIKNYVILCSLITGFFLPSCKKEPPEYYIHPDFKNWSCYKKGSYWVYLNETSGTQDCTWVIRDTNYVRFYNSGYDYDQRYNEYFETNVSGSLFDGFHTVAGKVDHTTMNILPSYFGRISYSYELIQYPEFSHRIYRNMLENFGVAEIFPQEVVNGSPYLNVYDIRHEWISEYLYHYGDSLIVSVHLVKNVGIVKLRKYQEGADSIWSLLRYKVYQ